MRTGRWEIVHDVTCDPRFYRRISEATGFPTRSILCVPMIAKGRVIGAIELLNKIGGDFDEEDALRLMRMAAFIAVAIENTRLFQQVTAGRDRIASVLRSNADGILMADMRGEIPIVDSLAVEICGCPEESLIGRRIDDIVAELHARAHDITTPSWRQEVAVPAQIGDLAFASRAHRYVRLIRLPVYDAQNEPCGELLIPPRYYAGARPGAVTRGLHQHAGPRPARTAHIDYERCDNASARHCRTDNRTAAGVAEDRLSGQSDNAAPEYAARYFEVWNRVGWT